MLPPSCRGEPKSSCPNGAQLLPYSLLLFTPTLVCPNNQNGGLGVLICLDLGISTCLFGIDQHRKSHPQSNLQALERCVCCDEPHQCGWRSLRSWPKLPLVTVSEEHFFLIFCSFFLYCEKCTIFDKSQLFYVLFVTKLSGRFRVSLDCANELHTDLSMFPVLPLPALLSLYT